MRRLLASLAIAVLCLPYISDHASAAQRVVSSMRNVNAVAEARGFYLVPVASTTAVRHAGDEAPQQYFELVRPHGERISIGRLHTSCSCVQLEAEKTTFERGERAILILRNVRPTPPAGQTYAMYVQVTSPIRTTLRVDTFIQSDRFRAAPPLQSTHVRPNYADYRY